MRKRNIITYIILFVFPLFFFQCEKKGLYTNSDDILSYVGLDYFFGPSAVTIQAGRLDYRNKGTYNFGTITLGTSSPSVVFTIENRGGDDLNLTGVPPVSVGGDDAADFTVTDPPITLLAPGASTTFTVTFTPGMEGARDGVITILYNSGKEQACSINMTGTGSATAVPDINLNFDGEDYSSGSTYDFGAVVAGGSSPAVTCAIQNAGAGALALTGSPTAVLTGGANPAAFTVSDPGVAAVASSSSAVFTVTFTPPAAGDFSAVITIPNDDPDNESPYTIRLRGTCVPPLAVSPVRISSGNANAVYARAADVVTLLFTAGRAIQTPSVTIAGNPAAVSGGPLAWRAEYTVQAGDPEGPVAFVISGIEDLDGIMAADVSATTDGSAVTIDLTAPAAVIAGEPTGISGDTVLNVTVSGADVLYYRYKAGAAAATDCATAAGYSADVPSATAITDDISGLADGAVNLCVVGRDTAGNYQPYSAATAATWTKDTSAPVATITGQPTGVSGTTALNVDVAGADIQYYRYKVGETAATDCVSAAGYGVAVAESANITDDISALGDVSITLCVVGQNSASQWQPYASATTASWTKDTTAPTVAIGAPSTSPISSTGSSSFAVTYTGADTVNLTNANISQTGTTTCGTVNVSGGTTAAPTVTLSNCAGNGTVAITVAANTASDTAGNWNLAEGPSAEFTVDNINPTVGLTVSPTINLLNYTAYTVSGSCSDNGIAVTVTVGGLVSDTPTCTSGAFTTISMNVGSVPDGASVSVTASQTDAAGNSGIGSATVLKDTVRPTVAMGAPSTTLVNAAGSVTCGITYTGADTVDLLPTGVTLGRTGTADCAVNVLNGTTATPTVSLSGCTGNGTVTISIDTATSYDAAGNYNFAVGPGTAITVDNTVPSIASAVTQDSDNDGRIDRYMITFDNNVNDSTFVVGNWIVAGYTVVSMTSGAVNDNVIYLNVTEMTFPDTGAMPDLTTVVAGAVRDLAGNNLALVGTSTVTEADGALPRIESVVGAVNSDRVSVTFTEPVDSSPALGCSGNVSSLNYVNNAGGGATTISAWQDASACDDSTVVVRTNLPVAGADIDADGIATAALVVYDNGGNAADVATYTMRGMMESVNFRFDTTSNGANVAGSVSDFPVLLRITNTELIDKMRSDCGDILFVDRVSDGGEVLPFEVERCDTTNHLVDVWVLVPTVSGNDNTDYITMYFNEKTDGTVPGRQEPGRVFSTANGFIGVWHLGESSGTIAYDSTDNKNNGNTNTTTINYTGNIALARTFNGSNYVLVPDDDSLDAMGPGGVSVSAWVKDSTGTGDYSRVVSKKSYSPPEDAGYELFYQGSSNNIWMYSFDTTYISGNAAADIDTNWHYIAGHVYDTQLSGDTYIFFDGADVTGTRQGSTQTYIAGTEPLYFGTTSGSFHTYYFTGSMDEVRIENVYRGSDWIKLCYENQRIDQTLVSSWYNNLWNYRIKIRVNGSLVTTSGIENFPVYVNLANLPSDFFTHVSDINGGDILVTAGDGITRLPRELVSFDNGGAGQLFFRAPALSNADNTHFYIYFNSSSMQTNEPEVWSNGYAGVWHMEDDSGIDATGNYSPWSLGGLQVPGTMGFALYFNGSTFFGFNVRDSTPLVSWGTGYGILAWFTPDADSNINMSMISGNNGGNGFELMVNPWDDAFMMYNYAGGTYTNSAWADMSSGTINPGTAAIYGILVDGNNASFRFNGSDVTSAAMIDAYNAQPEYLYFGISGFTGPDLVGTLDEVRIMNVPHGIEWMNTETNNMRLQTSFIIPAGAIEAR